MTSLHYLIALVLCGSAVTAYKDGAPEKACDDLAPNHKNVVPQIKPSPYKIKCEQFGNVIKMTVGGPMFRGLFAQIRDEQTGNKYGIFENKLGYQRRCDQQGITHINNNDKANQIFTITDLKIDSVVEEIVCIVTIVQDRETYWLKQTAALTKGRLPAAANPGLALGLGRGLGGNGFGRKGSPKKGPGRKRLCKKGPCKKGPGKTGRGRKGVGKKGPGLGKKRMMKKLPNGRPFIHPRKPPGGPM